MTDFEKIIKQGVKVMYHIAGCGIVVMMLLTCADVTLRLAATFYAKYGWLILAPFRPIPGTYELVCFLGSVAAAFAMAHTSVEEGHVSVNFVTRLLPDKLRSAFQIGTGLLSLILFFVIAWQSLVYAQKIKELGEVSMTLRLPFYPFVYGVALSAFAVCVVVALAIIKELLKVFDQ